MAVSTAFVATLVSAVFAVTLLRRFLVPGRRRRALLYWGLALAMFGLASGSLLAGVLGGWSPVEFRSFYLFGAVLNVPWLAVGSLAVNARTPAVSRWTGGVLLVVALLVVRAAVGADEPALWWPAVALATTWAGLLLVGREWAVVNGSMAVLGVYSVIATWTVLRAPFVAALPATGLPEGSELFAPAVRGYAVGGNAVGAVTVIVSALVASAVLVWRRPARSADRLVVAETREAGYVEAIARWILRGRTGEGVGLAHLVRGNLMIAAGVGIAAAGGVFSFLGDTAGHAVGFTLGVIVMYAGFLRTTRRVAGQGPGA